MGVETPLALLGLLAAALPWLAHRIRRRDLQPWPIPTFALLVAAEAKKRRSRGVTDLLLLLLRMALIATAVIALAAPYVSARLSFGDGTLASAVIVIDDSMSMMRRDGAKTLLASALDRARDALGSLPPGSEASVVLAGAPARVLVKRTRDLGLPALALERMPETTLRGADFQGAFTLAAEQLSAATHERKRVLVLSDFATHTQLSEPAATLPAAELTLTRLGSVPPPTNVYITSVRALPDPAVPGQIAIAVEVAASGPTPERIPVSVRVQERELARTEITLAAGRGRASLRVNAPDPSSDPTAVVRIESRDALDLDNSAGLLLRRTDSLSVMLVNGDPHPATRRDELHYALAALRLLPADLGSLALRAVDVSALAKHDLAQIDVLVLANVAVLDANLVERIDAFVTRGGGLIIAPGDRVAPRAYQAAFGPLLPCSLRARVDSSVTGIAAGPVADEVLGTGAAGLAQVVARTHLALECADGVALRFSDGSPALAVGTRERGKTALLALPLDADWSDMPLRPGYLALLAQLTRYVGAATTSATGTLPPHEPAQIRVPPGADRVEVVLPDGARERFDDLRGQATVTLEETHLPGPYRVLAASSGGLIGDASRGAFVIEPPKAESDLTPIAQLEALERSESKAKAATTVHRSLSPLVFLLVGLMIAAEGLLRLRRA